jgi:benzoyl-CoA reductase/2-hydroxyglutaryl-CoA dehydratase subunit BcrC/BadD/HgdB
MKGLSETFTFQKRIPLQFNFMMPAHLNSKHSLPFLKEEILRLKTFLETNVGVITPQDLNTSVRLFNQIREKIQNLYHLRQKWPGLISGSDFAHIVRAGYLLDRGRYVELLTKYLDELPRDKEGKRDLIPVYLVGNMVHSPVYFSMIEEVGARVVSDDLCSGARFLRLKTREGIDPIEALAERYFPSFLCPTKHKGAQAHIETLLTEVEKSGARGVIFLLYKYCETHFFDYPDLKSALESKGIPTLLLEVEDPSYSIGQLKIRIQAFVEMLNPI